MESRDDCGPPDCQSNVDCDGLWESRHRPWLWVEQTPLVRFKRQKDIAPQVLMATTNGTFGSQPFGFSTGTSGCTNDGKVLAAQKTEFFVAATLENLAGDMARGQGEHLTASATLLGVPTDSRRCLLRWCKNVIASSSAVERPHRVRSSKHLMRLWQDIRLWPKLKPGINTHKSVGSSRGQSIFL
jgi:hypothetical protein